MKIRRKQEEVHSYRVPTSYFIYFFFLFFVVFGFIFVIFGFYKNHWDSGLPKSIARILPFPAAVVEGDKVLYSSAIEYASLYKFSNNNGDYFEAGLLRAVNMIHLFALADELNVSISKNELNEYALDDLDGDFLKAVGWTENKYRKYVIKPLILSQELELAVYNSHDYQKRALAKVDSIYQNIEMGIDFDDLALQYSESLSSDNGGFIGFFEKDDLANGYEALFDFELGQVSEVIETDRTFVIAKVFDIVEIDDERVGVGVQEIVVKKDELSEVLDRFIEGREVKYWVQ